MNTPPDEAPRFVTYPCHHCNKGMEFMARYFAEYVNRVVACPHCHRETKIDFKQIEQLVENRVAISSEVRREVWRRDEGKCVKCGSRKNLEYDHIIPVSKGGSNTVRNVELLCEECNRAKSDLIQ